MLGSFTSNPTFSSCMNHDIKVTPFFYWIDSVTFVDKILVACSFPRHFRCTDIWMAWFCLKYRSVWHMPQENSISVQPVVHELHSQRTSLHNKVMWYKFSPLTSSTTSDELGSFHIEGKHSFSMFWVYLNSTINQNSRNRFILPMETVQIHVLYWSLHRLNISKLSDFGEYLSR